MYYVHNWFAFNDHNVKQDRKSNIKYCGHPNNPSEAEIMWYAWKPAGVRPYFDTQSGGAIHYWKKDPTIAYVSNFARCTSR